MLTWKMVVHVFLCVHLRIYGICLNSCRTFGHIQLLWPIIHHQISGIVFITRLGGKLCC